MTCASGSRCPRAPRASRIASTPPWRVLSTWTDRHPDGSASGTVTVVSPATARGGRPPSLSIACCSMTAPGRPQCRLVQVHETSAAATVNRVRSVPPSGHPRQVIGGTKTIVGVLSAARAAPSLPTATTSAAGRHRVHTPARPADDRPSQGLRACCHRGAPPSAFPGSALPIRPSGWYSSRSSAAAARKETVRESVRLHRLSPTGDFASARVRGPLQLRLARKLGTVPLRIGIPTVSAAIRQRADDLEALRAGPHPGREGQRPRPYRQSDV